MKAQPPPFDVLVKFLDQRCKWFLKQNFVDLSYFMLESAPAPSFK